VKPLPFQIKICGVTSSHDAAMAIGAGATAIGLNFFVGSPRHIDRLEAQNIARIDARELAVVGVFVNHTISQIDGLVTHVEPTWIQLHGDESAHFIKHVKQEVDLPIIRALRWGPAGGAAIDEYLQACSQHGCLPDALLIDAHAPGQYGGTGEIADWQAIAKWRQESKWDIPLVLAGGLTPENVAEAIAIVQPDAVDTASGVESAPGKKDSAKVKGFVQAAKEAFLALGRS
jgi:phosphoribosylanthranilate isomerase